MAQDFAKKKTPTAPAKSRSKSAASSSKKTSKRKGNTRTATQSPQHKPKKAPIWLWLVGIFGLVGFALFLNHLSDQAAPTTPTAVAEKPKDTPPTKEESQARFDFYQILKGHEVEVDEKVINSTPEASNIIYWLQVASFKTAADADNMRVKLLLINLNASIEKTTNKQAQVWHRVMVGPFTSRSRLAKARSILASNELNAITIKRKAQP